ncbi:MAG: hypothetical protein QOE65_1615 [Solirubrobacteraceae bacterium]|jgi:hypothetical protein|nr:hypothetical protein [Solirubrobacteraceae bacterium]
MRRLLTATGAGLAGAALAPAAASAHGIGQRADLPIPQWLFGWAAAVVLIVSFVGLALLWQTPRLQAVRLRGGVRIPAVVDVVCGAIGVAVFGIVVYAGLAGSQTATANVAPTFVFVHFWVGLVVASVLLGDVFRLFNPWRAIARAVGWLVGRLAPSSTPEPLPYPERLGRWPAVATLLGFGWLELAYQSRDDPSTLAILGLAYALIQLAGMSFYGVEPWTRRADGFGVYFNLFSRLSPWERRDGVLYLRTPLSGVTSLSPVPGTVALLCAIIGITTFDGFSQGSIWQNLAPDVEQRFLDIGFSLRAAVELTYTLGLAGGVAFVSGVFWLGVTGMHTVGRGRSTRELARQFAHTLVPIGFAYAVAHYFSLLVFQGQATGYLISDPLGQGSDLFGTANTQIDYSAISANGIWYVQVGALVAGHVAGLILAHDRALAIYDDVREATRSQYWMLMVMIGFTSLGLWLLSATNA